MERLVRLIRSVAIGDERHLARVAQAREVSAAGRALIQFERSLAIPRGGVVVGRTVREDGSGECVGLSIQQLLSRSWWWTGSSGGGKTLGALSILAQILRRGKNPVIVVDPKGEMAELLRDLVLPALVKDPECEALLENLRVIRPFDSDFVPELRLTEPEPNVPREVQALGIATSLAEASGADLGRRMEHVLVRLVSLAIERKEPLTVVARWLDSPQAFGRAAQRSEDSGLRTYAREEFPKENRETLRALRWRLAGVLLLPSVREALEAPRCVSFEDCLTRGITIFDLSDPPGGLDAAVRVVGGIVVGRLTRAILNRSLEGGPPHVVVVIDEFQELVRRFESVSFGRLLALARHKRVSLHFINQQRAQLGSELTQLLRTNTGFECAFRCNWEDAEALAHVFPVPEGGKNSGEARRAFARRMTQLPTRSFFFWVKERPFPGQIVRSPRLDLEALRSVARGLPPETLERLRRGTVAIRRERRSPRTEAEREDGTLDRSEFLPPVDASERREFPCLG